METKSEFDSNNEINEQTGEQLQELSHSDKIVGIFTEPLATFKSISLFPLRTIDWLLPVLLLYILVSLSAIVSMTNPLLKAESKKMRYEASEKQIESMVKSGALTEEQANEQMKVIDKNMDQIFSPTAQIFSTVSILVFGFIFFFIISSVYYVFSKFVLRGEGSYKSVLVASGMVSYISMVQVFLITVLSMLTDTWYKDLSIGTFMGTGKEDLGGLLLSKIDPISI